MKYIIKINFEETPFLIDSIYEKDDEYILSENEIEINDYSFNTISKLFLLFNLYIINYSKEELEQKYIKEIIDNIAIKLEENKEYFMYSYIDITDKRLITSVPFSYSLNDYYSLKDFIFSDKNASEKILENKELIPLGKIYISKGQYYFTLNDLSIEGKNENYNEEIYDSYYKKYISLLTIDEYKRIVKNEAQKFVSSRFGSIMNYEYAKFLILNNKLAANGFFITDENRERVYIDIVNKDDDSLLDILSEYLTLYDKINEYIFIYNLLNQFNEDVNYATSKEEVKSLFIEFNTHF